MIHQSSKWLVGIHQLMDARVRVIGGVSGRLYS
jgi:hypothetical protein